MKFGLLGAGAMGGAILNGALKSGVVVAENVWVYDPLAKNRDRFAALGCHIAPDAEALGNTVDLLLIAVTPQVSKTALAGLKSSMDGKVVFSIMAGVTSHRIREMIEGTVRVLRIMPNVCARVNYGVYALCSENDLNEDERSFAQRFFTSIGVVEWMREDLIDSAAAVSGSGPAFIAMFAEAMADGGVMEGLPRDQAYRLTMHTLIGTAKMMLETDMHPGALKDQVSSPGGSTIVGVNALESHGFRGAVLDAIHTASRKNREF